MKKVLIISTHFAPDAHVGAKRITKFCKYLPQYGWQPIVLTSAISDFHRVDETLMAQLPKELEIYRIKRWHIFLRSDQSGQPSSHSKSKREKKGYNIFRKMLGKALNSVEFLDYSWLFPALIQCYRLIRKYEIDIVFSSSPNPEAHVVPLLLGITRQTPWICEFRDPWTKCFRFGHISYLNKRVQLFLELQVLKNASHIVAAVPSLLNGALSADRAITISKGHLIYNGYDPEDFSDIDKNFLRNERLVMTFVGTFGYHVQPDFLFRALARFLDRYPVLKKRLKLRLVGEMKEWDVKIDIDKKIRNLVIELALKEVVEFVPFQSHRSALISMLNSDILLFFIAIEPESPVVTDARITAKIFEYLYAKRPILALIPPNGDAAKILKQCNAGYIVPYGDLPSAVETLEQIWKDYESGNLAKWHFNERKIAKYDRRKQTKQLANIFDSMMRKTF